MEVPRRDGSIPSVRVSRPGELTDERVCAFKVPSSGFEVDGSNVHRSARRLLCVSVNFFRTNGDPRASLSSHRVRRRKCWPARIMSGGVVSVTEPMPTFDARRVFTFESAPITHLGFDFAVTLFSIDEFTIRIETPFSFWDGTDDLVIRPGAAGSVAPILTLHQDELSRACQVACVRSWSRVRGRARCVRGKRARAVRGLSSSS